MGAGEWKEIRLGDVCEKIYSGGTPSTKEESFWNGNLNWLSSGETRNKYVKKTEKTITQMGVDNSSTKFAEKGTILIASAGQGFTRGQTSMALVDTYINQSIIAIKTNSNILDNYYFLQWLTSKYQYLRNLSDANAIRGSITCKLMESLKIKIPSLPTQQKIAKILSNYDDLIENNNRRIELLEQEAKLIYDEWFVKFKFPDWKKTKFIETNTEFGKIPEGWEVKELKNFVEFIRGIEPGSKNYLEKENKISMPFLRVGDLGSRDSNIFVDKELVKNKVATREDILISMDGTVGIVKMGLFGAYSTGIRKISSKENSKLPKSFIYFLLKSDQIQDTIRAHARGSTILHASSSIEFMKFVFPNTLLLIKFNTIVDKILNQILIIENKNQNLKKTRDLLLPKLISGKIDVSELKIH